MKQICMFLITLALLISCGVDQKKYDAQVAKVDSLKKVNVEIQHELEGYKYSPAKVLADIKQNYEKQQYSQIKTNLDLFQKYHPESPEYESAKSIYTQSVKDQEIARKKAEAEAAKAEKERIAKMAPVKRIMEKYVCSEDVARMILRKKVQIGMTAEQCRAAWGEPDDINRTVGSFGTHEQWVYGSSYLYFEDGVMTSLQD